MGRIESGSIAVGDRVTVLPSGFSTRVRELRTAAGARPCAGLHASVAIVLANELDVSRGDLIVREEAAPEAQRQLRASLCWLGDTPLVTSRKYLLRHTTREVSARVERVDHRWNVFTQEREAATGELRMNDIAQVALALAQPIFPDRYAENSATGSFILIDEATNNTVAAGMIQ